MGHLVGVSQKPIAFEWYASSSTIRNAEIDLLGCPSLGICTLFSYSHIFHNNGASLGGKLLPMPCIRVGLCECVRMHGVVFVVASNVSLDETN